MKSPKPPGAGEYYQHLREHYAMGRISALIEVVKSYFVGDIEDRRGIKERRNGS